MIAPLGRHVRQRMAQLHRWTGVLLIWLLFVIFLTGTLSFFRQELTQWMQPERPQGRELAQPEAALEHALPYLWQHASAASHWTIVLPGERSGLLDVSWRGAEGRGQAYLHPDTGEGVQVRDTRGGEFFYRFHFQLHYLPVLTARYLVGIAAMMMLLALISGVLTHKKILRDFFTFRWGKGQRSWLDAHNGFSVLALPFHLMITYTGLVTLMTLYVPWGMDKAFPEQEQRQQLIGEIFAFMPSTPSSGQVAALTSVPALVEQARASWQGAHVGRVQIAHPGDLSAKVLVEAQTGQADRLGISGHPPFMLFDGVTGELLKAKASRPAYDAYGTLLGLHLGRFADWPGRWLYALLGAAGCGMLATGMLLWTSKRRRKPGHSRVGLWLVERLNVATLAGFPVAVVALFWLNRLLPVEMTARAQWEIHGLFLVWLGMGIHALLRPLQSGWREQLGLAGLLLLGLPVLNLLTTDRGFPASLAAGDGVFIGFDLLSVLLALLMFRCARRRRGV
ncbi:PepSY-associated TM helix domain-containing protein [Marinobacterium marinum]|uniref:PepSY domain-containing protein n=1 Tax=Marinobacterium marinum TaxID=2756129 RepID=A0A7W1WZZ3_9GAMM|nr:PepSY-associated TM helix domain-containing protein [Marinobacterium marinum]MBA4503254.1 PepSY domain-containing protein [Marinobacterium marinum]